MSCIKLIYYAGGGTSNDRSEQRVGTTPLSAGSLPSSSAAKQEYEAQGGQIPGASLFGADPLRNRPDLVLRRDGLLAASNPPFKIIFCNTVSGTGNQLKDCILSFIDITLDLEQLL